MTYTKYSASGNDFIIFHTFNKQDYSKKAISLCNRTQGIGADGLIVLIPNKTYDFEWLFYNSDGSTALMCANGTRACAHYAYNNNLAKRTMSFQTGAGIIYSEVSEDIVQTQLTKHQVIKEDFKKYGYTWSLIDTGVPHLVCIVEDLDNFDINLCVKMRQKYNANVNFVQVKNKKLFVRTFEKGVEAETLACGTGMVACFIRANELFLVENEVFVYPKSKEELSIRLENDKLYLKGKVKKVFVTQI